MENSPTPIPFPQASDLALCIGRKFDAGFVAVTDCARPTAWVAAVYEVVDGHAAALRVEDSR